MNERRRAFIHEVGHLGFLAKSCFLCVWGGVGGVGVCGCVWVCVCVWVGVCMVGVGVCRRTVCLCGCVRVYMETENTEILKVYSSRRKP